MRGDTLHDSNLRALMQESYFRFEDMAIDIGGLLGRRVAIVGFSAGLAPYATPPHFELGPTAVTNNHLTVAIDRLSGRELKRLLRFGSPIVALRATVERAANGGYYLRARAVDVLGGMDPGMDLNSIR